MAGPRDLVRRPTRAGFRKTHPPFKADRMNQTETGHAAGPAAVTIPNRPYKAKLAPVAAGTWVRRDRLTESCYLVARGHRPVSGLRGYGTATAERSAQAGVRTFLDQMAQTTLPVPDRYLLRLESVLGYPARGLIGAPGRGILTPSTNFTALRPGPEPLTWPEPEKEPEPCFWLALPEHGNAYHWLINAMPALMVARDRFGRDWSPTVILSGPLSRFQRSALHFCRLKEPRYRPCPAGSYRFRQLVYPSPLGRPLPEPDPALLRYREQVLRILNRKDPRRPVTGRRLYISRQDARRRPLVNEASVIARLEARGFETVRLSELSFKKQVRAFAHADWIIGPHGAGLSHLLFARPGCRVLELFTDRYLSPCMGRIAQWVGLDYRFAIFTQPPGPDRPQRAWQADLAQLETWVDHWLSGDPL
ncbi:MAG: glycosyltransferase family 61 protein [Opitutales bacterium]